MTEPLPSHLADATLNEYLDEALAPAARALAEAHLTGCPACAGRLTALRTLFASLEALPEVALDRDLAPAVTLALRRAAPPRRAVKVEPRHPLYRLIFPMQALAALVLLIFAWPLMAAQFGALAHLPLPTVSLWSDLLVTVQNMLAMTQGPTQLLADLRQGAQPLLSAFEMGPALDVPLNLLFAVAAGTGLLWLLSHAWLLQHPQRQRARR